MSGALERIPGVADRREADTAFRADPGLDRVVRLDGHARPVELLTREHPAGNGGGRGRSS